MVQAAESNGLGLAKGVDGHALVLVDLGHFLVLGVAEQGSDGHLFGGVHPRDEQTEEHRSDHVAEGASNDDEADGQAQDGDGEEERDETDAQSGHDVLTPGCLLYTSDAADDW